jgi:hypothetical protein
MLALCSQRLDSCLIRLSVQTAAAAGSYLCCDGDAGPTVVLTVELANSTCIPRVRCGRSSRHNAFLVSWPGPETSNGELPQTYTTLPRPAGAGPVKTFSQSPNGAVW